MEQACLVTGKSSELLARVVDETAARDRAVLVARSGPLETFTPPEGTSTVSWNRRSALSARSVVLHGQNLHGRLAEAVVVFSPVRESVPFHDSSIVSVENRTDAEVKGYLFMIRELVSLFQKQGGGRLVLAVLDQAGALRSPLEAMSLGSFQATAEALQRFYEQEPIEIRLCYSRSDDPEGYAGFIVDTLTAPRARRQRNEWLRYGSRGGFFSRP